MILLSETEAKEFVIWHNNKTINKIDSLSECNCPLKEQYISENLECNDFCWLFRWCKCSTKREDGICDHVDRRKRALEDNGGPTGFDWY